MLKLTGSERELVSQFLLGFGNKPVFNLDSYFLEKYLITVEADNKFLQNKKLSEFPTQPVCLFLKHSLRAKFFIFFITLALLIPWLYLLVFGILFIFWVNISRNVRQKTILAKCNNRKKAKLKNIHRRVFYSKYVCFCRLKTKILTKVFSKMSCGCDRVVTGVTSHPLHLKGFK